MYSNLSESIGEKTLLELRQTHIGNKIKESNIKVNDIVTVLDENQKRNK